MYRTGNAIFEKCGSNGRNPFGRFICFDQTSNNKTDKMAHRIGLLLFAYFLAAIQNASALQTVYVHIG
jgi:hypothetical protein